MTVPADIRGEIVRLRTEGLTLPQIALMTRLPFQVVKEVCRKHFFDQEGRAKAALMREVAEARRLMADPNTPLYRPARGLT